MTNKIKNIDLGERSIGFIRLKAGLKLTVDIDPEWEPLEIPKHSTNKNLYECTGRSCPHCAKGVPRERYWRIKVLETVKAGKLEQYIDLSHNNFDVFHQICYGIEDIGASNPFTFECMQYDKGNSFHIRNSSFAQPHYLGMDSGKTKVANPVQSTKPTQGDDDEWDFDFGDD